MSWPDYPAGHPVPSDVEGRAFMEDRRKAAKEARYAQLHPDNPPHRGFVNAVRHLLRAAHCGARPLHLQLEEAYEGGLKPVLATCLWG